MSTPSKWPEPVQTFEYPSVLGKGLTKSRRSDGGEALRESHIRQQAQHETEERLRDEFQQTLAEERRHITAAVADFSAQADDYYRRVEAEVVQLSLAIARQILHREAQADPLMLAGVVRVALDQLHAATEIKLHVAPGQSPSWRKLFEDAGGTQAVTVIEEPLFAPAQVRLESNLGTVDLGVEDQLKEIEQGFFDLLAARPR